ncbi:disease resistance protein At4g27190-like [Coffea eugenioides]|uniref:disease resistance protein At4g27190-like n=1 Tax=Coffea eugenioides TaxID=49369 RepID=UPI000F610F34|nr:disease resistance protein At4g27190-like [Coffea eugenioides]
MPSCLPNIIGAVIAPGVQAIKDASTCLKDKYDKVKKIKQNLDKLENEERLVHATKSDLEYAIARNSIDMEPTETANTWLELVKEREREVQELKNKYLHIHKCLCGMWPFYKLMKLSEDLMEKTDELKKLKADIDLQNALREKQFEPGEIMLGGDGDHIPKSMSETVEELLKCLGDKEVRRIGIWGMAGVGKTRILMHLNDKAYQLGKLNPIIWVKVQKEGAVKNIQSDILARLKLEDQHMDRTAHVAHKISMALEKLDYLLLLDQCPGDIDLNEVGIHHKHKGKVIVASRDKPDCAAMDIHRVFKVSKLSDGDAEELFKETVGDIADHPHFKGIKEQILKQLGGLPLAIKTIARSLKDQPEAIWHNTLRELQSPKNFGDQFEELFKAFDFSYKNLPGDDFRKCLLYGALFAPDYQIDKDYLTECWISEQFIPATELNGADTNVQQLRLFRDRGHKILQELTKACLFEWCSRSNFLTMPTPFRKIALTFTYPQEEGSSSSSLLVRGEEKLFNPPEKEHWIGAKRISLMCNGFKSLPECPECPTTTTLLLQRNEELDTIDDSFFASMVQLRVLDLHHTKIESLPSSITKLVKLKSLYLNECRHLVSLSEDLGKLANLEILDIRDTGLQSLPTEVALLVKLRCLRVSFVYNPLIASYSGDHNNEDNQPRQIIPHNVIGLLYHLEELTIIVDPREQSWNDVVTSVVEEITNLESLTTLFIYFPKVEFLTTFIDESRSWKNTRRYRQDNSFRAFRIIVGSNGENHNKGLHSSRGPAERHLRFSAGENVCCEAIRKVLRRSNAFELIGNQDTTSLSDIGIDCMESLEVCVVEDCDQISSIISCGTDAASSVFRFLEKLHLVNLKSLCCILDGSVGTQSFSKLTSIIVLECSKLKKLISLGMVKNLENLKHLKIQDCLGIEEVIETMEPNGELLNLTGFLPKLEILELVNLPLLESICKNDSLDWRSLQKIEIIDCFKLNTWSRGMYNAQHLRNIECQEPWWRQLQLPDEVKGQLKKRCYFIWKEVPSVYYTPREDRSHQPPDLLSLSDRFEQHRMRHEDSISQGSSSRRYSP